MPVVERLKTQVARSSRHPWVSAGVLVVGIGGVVVVLTVGSSPHPNDPDKSVVYGWAWAVLVFSIGVLLFAAAALSAWDNRRKILSPNRRAKIDQLSHSLKEALDVIDTVRGEVAEGERLLTELERRRESAKRRAKLSQEEVDAVVDAVGDQFQRAGRRNLASAAMFTVIGAALGVLFTKLFG